MKAPLFVLNILLALHPRPAVCITCALLTSKIALLKVLRILDREMRLQSMQIIYAFIDSNCCLINGTGQDLLYTPVVHQSSAKK
jgi:hypothetical protein